MIDDAKFFENLVEPPAPLDPRCPLVLVLDTSAAMTGAPMSGLNAGLRAFKSAIARDARAALRVEVAVVSFGASAVRLDFSPAGQFNAPLLQASGATPVGPAINLAFELLDERKRDYATSGVECYRPWIFLVTGRDESPYDQVWQEAAQRVKEAEARKKAAFFSVGLQDADVAFLNRISTTRKPLKLRDAKFTEMFGWLASSMIRVANSKVESEVKLESPLGWGSI